MTALAAYLSASAMVFSFKVGVFGQDLLEAHAVGDHSDHSGDREPQVADAGHSPHPFGVRGNAFEGHAFTLLRSPFSPKADPGATLRGPEDRANAGSPRAPMALALPLPSRY